MTRGPRRILIGVVVVIGMLTVAIGLGLPDGDLRAPNVVTTARPEASASSAAEAGPKIEPAEPSAAATEGPVTQALAPASVRGVWPGRPAATTVDGQTVDWCPAVVAEPTARTLQLTSPEAADAAACRAVAFLFDARYSRLSLPRSSYSTADFELASSLLSQRARERTYPRRVQDAIASPRSEAARRGTGLLLLDGPAAGAGREFFGPAFTTDGYADRAVWVDPHLSAVDIDATSSGTIGATVEVSAAVPVWNPATSSAEQMRISTNARITLVGSGATWAVDSWSLQTERPRFEPLRASG